jgi:hypothetical protein
MLIGIGASAFAHGRSPCLADQPRLSRRCRSGRGSRFRGRPVRLRGSASRHWSRPARRSSTPWRHRGAPCRPIRPRCPISMSLAQVHDTPCPCLLPTPRPFPTGRTSAHLVALYLYRREGLSSIDKHRPDPADAAFRQSLVEPDAPERMRRQFRVRLYAVFLGSVRYGTVTGHAGPIPGRGAVASSRMNNSLHCPGEWILVLQNMEGGWHKTLWEPGVRTAE